MYTGNLTPRSNTAVKSYRYTGDFGQPHGFASVLTVGVRKDGRLVLTLVHKKSGPGPDEERVWSVELTNEQRNHLADWIDDYQPTLFEKVEDD